MCETKPGISKPFTVIWIYKKVNVFQHYVIIPKYIFNIMIASVTKVWKFWNIQSRSFVKNQQN